MNMGQEEQNFELYGIEQMIEEEPVVEPEETEKVKKTGSISTYINLTLICLAIFSSLI